MTKKKTEEKKEEKKKTSSKPKKYPLKELFEKAGTKEDTINEILMMNGITTSIDETNIRLTESEFEEVINNHNNKRL